jgi:amino acid transporter
MADSIGVPESRVGEEGGLKRAIGPRLLLLFIIGDMLGTGIYARVGGVAGEVGGIIWVSFLAAFVLAGLTAFAYSELVTKYPGSAGAALYTNRAFRTPFFTFMVAFAVICSGLASAGAAARAFGGTYLAAILGLEELSVPAAILVAILFVVVLSIINFIGISESLKTNLVLTVIELTGLLIIVFIGVLALLGGSAEPARTLQFSGDGGLALAVLAGASVAFYALIGFEDSVNVAEETQNPSRAFPRALFTGIALAGVVYLAVAFVAAAVVDPAQLAEAESGPLLLVVEQGPLGIPLGLFSVFALVAITNTALANLIMGSRVLYGMAREGVMPGVLGRVHRGRGTPHIAIFFVALVLLVLVATGELSDLANTTVLLLLLVFAVVNVAVLALKRDRVGHNHFEAPSFIPILALIAIGALLIKFVTDTFAGGDGPGVVIRVVILLAVGALLYLVNNALKGRARA